MIVMKFGGTSVQDASAIRRLVSIVHQELTRRPVVVVSAMAGTTNGLLAAAELAASGRTQEAEETVDSIALHHFQTAEELVPSAAIDSLRASLELRFLELHSYLKEIARAGTLLPALSDAVVANGELLSSQLVAAALQEDGLKSVWVDIRLLLRTDSGFTRATVDFDITDSNLAKTLNPILAADGVPVTQGFIGSTHDGETTTIGRGGSDYSAAIVGAALNVEEIQIWTDVDGIMTTDPRLVAEASKVKIISFAEAAELAYFGAKVLHPSTLLPAMAKEISVSVRNSRQPESNGTSIVRQPPLSSPLVKAIAFKRGITVVNVTSHRMLMAYGFLAKLFEIFARHQTAVDMVATSEVGVSMTLDDTRNLQHVAAELRELGDVSIESDQALICLVGEGLKFTPGIAARIFSSIGQVNVSMISHGASAINVSFIVAGSQVDEAVRALHREFFDEIDAETFEATGGRSAEVGA